MVAAGQVAANHFMPLKPPTDKSRQWNAFRTTQYTLEPLLGSNKCPRLHRPLCFTCSFPHPVPCSGGAHTHKLHQCLTYCSPQSRHDAHDAHRTQQQAPHNMFGTRRARSEIPACSSAATNTRMLSLSPLAGGHPPTHTHSTPTTPTAPAIMTSHHHKCASP